MAKSDTSKDDAACLRRALASLMQIQPGIEGQIRSELDGCELSPEEAKYLPKPKWKPHFRSMEDYLE